MSDILWNDFLKLPKPIRSRRISFAGELVSGETKKFSLGGKGCIKHWWFTYLYGSTEDANDGGDLRAVHNVNLRIHFDGESQPSVNQLIDTFFGTFLDIEPVTLNSAPITVLKRNGFNSWFPMPFSDGFEYLITNNNPRPICIWFMADIHMYDEVDSLTPLRFKSKYTKLDPAPDYSFMETAEIIGKGFVTGIFHGTDARCKTDSWFHSGGDTWLLDGEGVATVIRGNGGEDFVGYSFGIHYSNYLWQGATYCDSPDGKGGRNTPCIFYRFFGPDAIVFNSSAICKFGTKASRIETNLYYYVETVIPEKINVISDWYLCAPFDGSSYEAFQQNEFPEFEEPSDKTFSTNLPSWQPNPRRPEKDRPQPYVGRWVKAESKRGWIDFLDHFRGINFANNSTCGENGAAYALGWINSEEDKEISLNISYDDWIKVWVNDLHIFTNHHDKGFETDQIKVPLVKGRNKILIKLSNSVNLEFFTWAFHLAIDKNM